MIDGGGLVLEGTDDGLVQQRLLDVRRDLTLRLLHLIGVATHTLVVDLAEDCEQRHPHAEDKGQRRAEVIQETESADELC